MSHAHYDTIQFTQEFWDDRYGSSGQLWSGQPNPQLVAQAADLAPGEALEAGCGEGADAIWLARRGWTVTAVDVSAVALDRAAGFAAAAGGEIAGRITWQREDLRSWAPGPRRFDLVSAQYMHLPEAELDALHGRLAAAVRPGGTLLVVAHHPGDLHALTGREGMFRTAEELAASLHPDAWKIIVAGNVARSAANTDGQPVTVRDTVLRAVRVANTGLRSRNAGAGPDRATVAWACPDPSKSGPSGYGGTHWACGNRAGHAPSDKENDTAMPATLQQTLLAPEIRPQVIDDCQALIEQQVSDVSGISGAAVKIAYKTVSAFKPGFIRHMMEVLVPEMADKLEPFWADFSASGGAGFGDYLAKRSDEVSEALLSITDEHARHSEKPTVVKAYNKVRPSAAKHVTNALPAVGALVQKYAG